MGKLRKLVRHPVLFFVDAVKKRTGGTAVSVSQGPRKTKAEKQPDAEVLKAREATQTNVTKVERLKTQEDKAEKSSTEGKKDVMASEVAASKGRNLAAEGGNAAKKPRVQPEGAQNVPAKSADDDDGFLSGTMARRRQNCYLLSQRISRSSFMFHGLQNMAMP